MEDINEHTESPPLFPKRRSGSSLCLSCCFGKNHRHRRLEADADASESERPTRLNRSSSMWIKSRAQEIPELEDKYRKFISSIGGFHYDALTYSLNFDQGYNNSQYLDHEFPLRNFSARLPTVSRS